MGWARADPSQLIAAYQARLGTDPSPAQLSAKRESSTRHPQANRASHADHAGAAEGPPARAAFAFEMGHYFGLCPFGHSGFQNIMFSLPAGNNLWDWGLFGFYLNAEPYFTSVDKRNVWRFIVDQLRDEL